MLWPDDGMTDTAHSSSNEPFWTRVRAALGALRPDQGPPYGRSAIGGKGRLGGRIEEELHSGWERAAGKKVSLSLLVIEIDRVPEYFNAYGKAAMDSAILQVMQAATDALPRSGDACLRLGRATFVVVLPDLPVLLARTHAAAIRDAIRRLNLQHKESHAGVVTVSMGLAVTNPAGAYDKSFFDTAMGALTKAQRKGLGRLVTTDLRPGLEHQRRAA